MPLARPNFSTAWLHIIRAGRIKPTMASEKRGQNPFIGSDQKKKTAFMNSTLFADRLKGFEIALAQIPSRGGMKSFLAIRRISTGKAQMGLIPSEQALSPGVWPCFVSTAFPTFRLVTTAIREWPRSFCKIDQIKIFSSGADAFFVKFAEILFLADPLARTIAFAH